MVTCIEMRRGEEVPRPAQNARWVRLNLAGGAIGAVIVAILFSLT